MRRLLLLTALISSFVTFAHAKQRKVKTTKAFNIQPKDGGASFLVVTGQTLDLESCGEEACVVKYKDESFSIPRMDLRTVVVGPRRSTAPAAARRSTITELGTSNTSRSEVDEIVRRVRSSSNFNTCFNRHKNTYTKTLYCRRGKRRYPCGTKSTAESGGLCYKGVKLLLLKCGATDRYIGKKYAKNAGSELLSQGFRKLDTKDPRKAPAGSVIVYDNGCAATHEAGHIEIKVSETQWVSDFIGTQPLSEKTPTCRPVKAIYFK